MELLSEAEVSMFKVIGNKILALKDRFTAEPAQLIDTVVLILIALGGLFIAVSEIVFHKIPLFKEPADVTLILVALLGLHFGIERFTVMDRMEKRTAFLDLAGIRKVPKSIKSVIEEHMKFHNDLRRLAIRTRQINPGFEIIAREVIKEHTLQLEGLSKGVLSVPREWKMDVYQRLMVRYQERFDAVSEDDLNYWESSTSDAKEYLDIASSSFHQHDTILTRIFLFNLNELSRRAAHITGVLRRQEQAGFGWGVAIREEVAYDVIHQNIPMDFTLHNGGKAVSLSRKRDRRYETIFARRRNLSDISAYKQAYKDLVPACWLVNQRFVESYQGVRPNQSWKDVTDKAQDRNKRLKILLPDTIIESDVFVLVVSQPQEIRAKVHQLVKVVNNYYRELRRR